MNKVETAVRITHIPSGITVTCQDERSQKQNKRRALTILEDRVILFEEEQKRQDKKELRDSLFKGRVRTYDFTRGIVYDHLTGKRADLDKIMDGNLELLRS